MARPVRILVVFGTRPEAIKLFPVVHALNADPRFTCLTLATGQHREMLDQVLDIAGITPDRDLDLMRSDQSLDALTAALITGIGAAIDDFSPDRVMVQGDTATAMAAALAAYYRKLPVDHVEAGLRTGDRHSPWPEEVNRRVISAIASLHFAPTATAQAALLAEGTAADTVMITGNTVIDALGWVSRRVAETPQLASGLADIARRFAGRRILAVTTHRRESHGPAMGSIADAVARLAQRPDVAVVLPVHRNPHVRAVIEQRLSGLGNVALTDPLDYPHFARLLAMADCVLTDSGGVQEEAPTLDKPVFVLRDRTERPEGLAAGTSLLVGTDADRIVAEVGAVLDDPVRHAAMAKAPNPFGDGRAATRIVERIALETAGRRRRRTGVQMPAYH